LTSIAGGPFDKTVNVMTLLLRVGERIRLMGRVSEKMVSRRKCTVQPLEPVKTITGSSFRNNTDVTIAKLEIIQYTSIPRTIMGKLYPKRGQKSLKPLSAAGVS
jgi:hypothetical protein